MQRPWIMGRGRVAIAVIGFLAGFATVPGPAGSRGLLRRPGTEPPDHVAAHGALPMGVALMGIPISAVLTPLLWPPSS